MRVLPLAAAVAALLVSAAPAHARAIRSCRCGRSEPGCSAPGYSVIQGTEISSFNVRVLDVAAGEATSGGGRILFEVSGPAVDATGLGPGFSGSPIYCPDEAGTQRVIGAIAESINEYGGKVALATPIEAIIGTPVDVPGPPVGPRRARRREPARRVRAQAPLGADAGRDGEREADGHAADGERRDRPGRAGAVGGEREGRPAGADRAARAARLVPGADAAARARRSRPATRTATSARARSAPWPTWTATGCGCSGTRSKPPAGARCCSRTPTSSGSSTTRTSSARSARRTSSPPPGTTSARSRPTASAPSRAAPACSRTPSRSR